MLFKQTLQELPPLPWAAPPPTSLQPSDTDGSRALALGPFCSGLCLDRVSQAFEASGLSYHLVMPKSKLNSLQLHSRKPRVT